MLENPPTPDRIQDWSQRYTNRGRWAGREARGTLNHLTPERVRAAVALARTGAVISCGLPAASESAVDVARSLEIPTHELRTASRGVASDQPFPYGTRWHAPAAPSQSTLFRAEPARAAAPAVGGGSGAVVGRGVLIDLPRLTHRPWLEDGTRIFPDDLDSCAERSGVAIEAGDVLLVRTGCLGRRLSAGAPKAARPRAPGLSITCARWLYERGVAAVASDTACVEVVPSEVEGSDLTLHGFAAPEMGLLLGELFALDELAAACAADGNYDFLFAAPPALRIPGCATAITPLAIR